HNHHHRGDDGHDLVEHEVRVQPRRQGGLRHGDPVRRSPGPSFPASPSRPLASKRSAKSTRSASSATSRRSSSTAASISSRPAPPKAAASLCAFSFRVYALVADRAIIQAKNPPTAMIGIRTPSSPAPISASRRRSLAWSDPLALPVLREQPLGEVHALGELRHLAPHGLELLVERLLVLRELGAHIVATRRRALAADPLGHRAADRRERHRDARAAPENEDHRQDVLHTVSAAALAEGRRGPSRAGAPRSRAALRRPPAAA